MNNNAPKTSNALSQGMENTVIPGQLTYLSGEGGLTKAQLRSITGHEVEVFLFGATITSWKSPTAGELLYLSPRSDFSGAKPIRGGIPLVFPQFSGLGPLPSHGFARTSTWTPKTSGILPGGGVALILSLTSAGPSEALWPHSFEVEYIIELTAKLKTSMRVTNRGSNEFSFNNAFHTYFAVSDISAVEVTPLGGLTYLDNTAKRAPCVENNHFVTFTAETDRVYVDAPQPVLIEDRGAKRTIVIEKYNLPDCVIWNPWTERCKAIGDLPEEAYKKFMCAEPANAAQAVSLAPQKTWECWQMLSYR
jgi:glucose-6-phosphate 1-epimerase